jgi:NTP pyrophosphatase (non-canonical NTP hydrolase)
MQKESTLSLPESPTLKDFQRYCNEMRKERGFTDQTIAQTFMLFLEECGELAKAARKTGGIKVGTHSADQHVDLEAADVFILLLMICDQCDIDLEKAFRDKEEIHKERMWS